MENDDTLFDALFGDKADEAEPQPTTSEAEQPAEELAVQVPTMVALADGQGLLADMFAPEDVSQVLAEQQFKRVDLDLKTDFRCPCCGYEWSGNPKPTMAEAAEALDA